MAEQQPYHVPVLAAQVVDALACRPGGTYVDCTVGGGGHAALILAASAPSGKLIGLDQDPDALIAAATRLSAFSGRWVLRRSNFSAVGEVLDELGVGPVDGFLFDLGVSSAQLDRPEKGFSYQHDAPLDMRMDPDGPTTAADLVNRLPAAELARIIRLYGEERWASRIAAFIEEARREAPILSTGRLVEVIKAAIPASARREGPHPAKRTFQALRIAVNRELDVIEPAIEAAARRLRPGGRLAVITFHSLEDRVVKHTLARLAGRVQAVPGAAAALGSPEVEPPLLRLVTRKPVVPSETEVAQNPRARSAKLRVAERAGSREKEG